MVDTDIRPAYVDVAEVCRDWGCSRSKGYAIIKQLSEQMKSEKRSESEEQQKMQSLQDTISKCKTLLKEQAQVIEQKESRISQLEKSLREKDAAYARLLQQKEEQKERLERKIESERSSYRYLNSRLRETEEELDRERGKSGWDKFRDKHCMRFLKKRYRSCYYTKKSFADWFAEKMMFPLGCVIFAVAVFAILNYFDLIWYMW